jgi:hypothetical protein
VDSSGVLRSAVTNLLLRSEEFENASWQKNAVTVSADAAISPNGTQTADKIQETAASNFFAVIQNPAGAFSTAYTWSCYAKASERNFLAINFSVSGLGGTWNLTTGVSNIAGGTSTAVFVGNGWWRLSVTFTTPASGSNVLYHIFGPSINNTISPYAGTAGSGIFLWGAQLEQASTVGEYVPTGATINSAPRFDHNPTTGESLGLLVEEARTNSVTNNTMVGAVAGTPGTNPTGWTFATAQSNGLTISITGTGVENGINYIDYRFNGTTVASPNACAFGFANATAATAQTWTNSLYWKLASGTTTGITSWQLGIIENTSGGAFVAGAFYSQTAPTSAALITQRPTASRTLSGGVTVGQVSHTMNIPVAGNTAIDFTVRLGLPQLEQGAFATSVIPTTSATVTRAADVASITGSNFSSWYNQTEGTVFAETQLPAGSATNTSGRSIIDINDGSTNNRIGLRAISSGTTGDQFTIRSGNTTVAQFASNGTAVSSVARKIAAVYKLDDFASWATGATSAATDTSGALPIGVNQLGIGSVTAGGEYLSGTIKRLTYWPVRLSNTTLQQITQP